LRLILHYPEQGHLQLARSWTPWFFYWQFCSRRNFDSCAHITFWCS